MAVVNTVLANTRACDPVFQRDRSKRMSDDLTNFTFEYYKDVAARAEHPRDKEKINKMAHRFCLHISASISLLRIVFSRQFGSDVAEEIIHKAYSQNKRFEHHLMTLLWL